MNPEPLQILFKMLRFLIDRSIVKYHCLEFMFCTAVAIFLGRYPKKNTLSGWPGFSEKKNLGDSKEIIKELSQLIYRTVENLLFL